MLDMPIAMADGGEPPPNGEGLYRMNSAPLGATPQDVFACGYPAAQFYDDWIVATSPTIRREAGWLPLAWEPEEDCSTDLLARVASYRSAGLPYHIADGDYVIDDATVVTIQSDDVTAVNGDDGDRVAIGWAALTLLDPSRRDERRAKRAAA